MKNLLNCHSVGLHSFPISINENGHLRRIFYADKNHNLWKPSEIAIHPHHVDIKITVLEGILFNPIYTTHKRGSLFNKYVWNSHITNGNGGFEHIGAESLLRVSNIGYSEGNSVTMKACELHSVFVAKNTVCAWLIEETKPSCEYFPINYSKRDLRKWDAKGLYVECSKEIADTYIAKFKSHV